MRNRELVSELDEFLQSSRFRDYAPNGLQVEGKEEITHIVTGVTASLALLEAAADLGADAVLVHHGWFWKSDSPCITGVRLSRIRKILSSGMNLVAYHLPLDAHPQVGNNAQIALRLGIRPEARWGEEELGWIGNLPRSMPAAEFAVLAERVFRRSPVLLGPAEKHVQRIAWCSGAAQSMFEEAVNQGADLYLSGEMSEPTFHLANELSVPYLACGHHATERFGIEALGSWVRDQFGIKVTHIDLENPV